MPETRVVRFIKHEACTVARMNNLKPLLVSIISLFHMWGCDLAGYISVSGQLLLYLVITTWLLTYYCKHYLVGIISAGRYLRAVVYRVLRIFC